MSIFARTHLGIGLALLVLLAGCQTTLPAANVAPTTTTSILQGPTPPRFGPLLPSTPFATTTPQADLPELVVKIGQATPLAEAEAIATTLAAPLPIQRVALPDSQPLVVAAPTAETISSPVSVALSPDLPQEFAGPLRLTLERSATLETGSGAQPLLLLDDLQAAGAQIRLTGLTAPGYSVMERYYAAVVAFDTVLDDVTMTALSERWQRGSGLVITPDVAYLERVLGAGSAPVVERDVLASVLAADHDTIAIVPFEALDPRFKVLTFRGVNLLSNRLLPGAYPLGVAVKVDGVGASLLAPLLRGAIQPVTNRDPFRLTTLVMTGVTAMARGTAEKMELKGYDYPARIIGPTLAEADITHVSNEIPFLDDCVVRNTVNNLTLCSDTTYWATLQLMGTDIVGLSGNHVNDFGYEGARRSLTWYRENKIPIYGSGFTVEEACAPLLLSHNGQRFAFIAALAFGPPSAWVTESEPGACYYYDHKERILASIQALAKEVDIVAVELQFEESYQPWPLDRQVIEFRDLRAAGAEIVTGVQSHVPQAMEPYGDPTNGETDSGGNGIIVYGLGNLFFDQMWSWETRTELYVRHTIYQGRLISSEILTGVLEDYAQPRWAEPTEREEILTRIFNAAPVR